MLFSVFLIASLQFFWNLGQSLSATTGLTLILSFIGSLPRVTALLRDSWWSLILSSGSDRSLPGTSL